MEYRDILEIFENNDYFTILTHKSPDGDCLGSGFALWNFLKDMGKHARVLNSDGFPDRYSFMYEGYAEEDFQERYVISVDVADPRLFGSSLVRYQEPGAVDLCIDHHFSNKHYARLNHVEGDASAAALILYKIFRLSGRPMTKIIAKCLYTGLATDTGCFKYENTTPQAHLAAAELMQHDIRYAWINRQMFDVKSRGRLEIEQLVTGRMEYCCDDKCAMIFVTTDLVEECGVDPSEFEGLASIPLSVEGVKLGITVRQRHKDVFKISVRTDEEIDASEYCSVFGGGGHIRAAGCEIKGTLEEVVRKLRENAERVLCRE